MIKKTLKYMSTDEKSLLTYIESRAVNHGGLIDSRQISVKDRDILKKWTEEGFIIYSRITYESLELLTTKAYNTCLVRLSEEAWQLAQQERRERYKRVINREPWSKLVTVADKRAGKTVGFE